MQLIIIRGSGRQCDTIYITFAHLQAEDWYYHIKIARNLGFKSFIFSKKHLFYCMRVKITVFKKQNINHCLRFCHFLCLPCLHDISSTIVSTDELLFHCFVLYWFGQLISVISGRQTEPGSHTHHWSIWTIDVSVQEFLSVWCWGNTTYMWLFGPNDQYTGPINEQDDCAAEQNDQKAGQNHHSDGPNDQSTGPNDNNTGPMTNAMEGMSDW